jgi:hypothetical protein
MPFIDITTNDYREAVEAYAKEKAEINFPNHGTKHASIVMETIFKNSNNVLVFSKGMNGTISQNNNYQQALHELLLDEKKSINYLLQNAPSPNSLTLNKLKLFPERAVVRVIKPEYIKMLAKDNMLRRFTVGDDRAYRLETNSDTNKAVCSFNNPKTARQLTDNFNYLYNDTFSVLFPL